MESLTAGGIRPGAAQQLEDLAPGAEALLHAAVHPGSLGSRGAS